MYFTIWELFWNFFFCMSLKFVLVLMYWKLLCKFCRVRMHYGHPDVFDRVFHITRGGISKASRVINISEDIFSGRFFGQEILGKTNLFIWHAKSVLNELIFDVIRVCRLFLSLEKNGSFFFNVMHHHFTSLFHRSFPFTFPLP